MKRFLALMIGCGFLLSGCSDAVDKSDSSAVPSVVASDDFIKNKVAAIENIEKPKLVTEGPLPKAIAEKTEYNFGRMALGSKSKTTFDIRNDGESELKLAAGKPTCQCTLFSLSKETVAPGETSVLTVSWDAKKVDRSFQHGGPVYTNDPEREALRFVVMGQVGAEYELEPAGNWNAGEPVEDTVGTVSGVLFSSVNEDFEIERIETEEDFITAAFRKLSVAELGNVNAIGGFEITMSVAPEFEPGEMQSPFRVFLKGREEPISAVVTARRNGPIRVLPTPGAVYTKEDNNLRLGGFSADQGKESSLMLLVDKLDEPLQLLKVTAVPPFVAVELKPMGKDNRRYLMKISIPAGVQKGLRDRKNPIRLRMETNHPGQKIMELNVTYRAS